MRAFISNHYTIGMLEGTDCYEALKYGCKQLSADIEELERDGSVSSIIMRVYCVCISTYTFAYVQIVGRNRRIR